MRRFSRMMIGFGLLAIFAGLIYAVYGERLSVYAEKAGDIYRWAARIINPPPYECIHIRNQDNSVTYLKVPRDYHFGSYNEGPSVSIRGIPLGDTEKVTIRLYQDTFEPAPKENGRSDFILIYLNRYDPFVPDSKTFNKETIEFIRKLNRKNEVLHITSLPEQFGNITVDTGIVLLTLGKNYYIRGTRGRVQVYCSPFVEWAPRQQWCEIKRNLNPNLHVSYGIDQKALPLLWEIDSRIQSFVNNLIVKNC